jgi:hypothetical protein
MQSTKMVRARFVLLIEEHPMIILPDASGYAWAISYESDISKVTLDNLVVFTTKYQYAFTRISRIFTDSCGLALPTAE